MFLGILRGKLVAEELLFLDFMFPRGAVPINVTKSPRPHPLLYLVNLEEGKGLGSSASVLSPALFGLELSCVHHLL